MKNHHRKRLSEEFLGKIHSMSSIFNFFTVLFFRTMEVCG
ncbi:hypothetical protein NY10_1720 [Carnobacterium antarcticum]|nr:hypothetical protein NY10_1720 [Carnobacterium sp. CP1]